MECAAADLRADAGLALRHDGVAEADDVDALGEHALGELPGDVRVIEHHGNDRVRAFGHVEAQIDQRAAEILRVLLQLVAQRGGGVEHLHHLQSWRRTWPEPACWRTDTAGTALPQQVDDLFARQREAAATRRPAPCRTCRSGCPRGPPRRNVPIVPRPVLPTKPAAWLSSTMTSAPYSSARSQMPRRLAM